MNAQELLDELLNLKEEFGSLDGVSVSVFTTGDEDRLIIDFVDVFTEEIDGKKSLHSIDLNVITD